jgi:hypothetical protein
MRRSHSRVVGLPAGAYGRLAGGLGSRFADATDSLIGRISKRRASGGWS